MIPDILDAMPKLSGVNLENFCFAQKKLPKQLRSDPRFAQYNVYTCKCLGCWKHVRGDVPKEAERGSWQKEVYDTEDLKNRLSQFAFA